MSRHRILQELRAFLQTAACALYESTNGYNNKET
jgi:hypothetical protein